MKRQTADGGGSCSFIRLLSARHGAPAHGADRISCHLLGAVARFAGAVGHHPGGAEWAGEVAVRDRGAGECAEGGDDGAGVRHPHAERRDRAEAADQPRGDADVRAGFGAAPARGSVTIDGTGVGPKLVDKLHVYVGDADTYFLDRATRALASWMKTTTNPHDEGYFLYGDNKPHCWSGPVSQAQRLGEMAMHGMRHMPAGTTTPWWTY